ncbi:hypothetical protein AVEN_140838-1, partial [Araneus ventricosus]
VSAVVVDLCMENKGSISSMNCLSNSSIICSGGNMILSRPTKRSQMTFLSPATMGKQVVRTVSARRISRFGTGFH